MNTDPLGIVELVDVCDELQRLNGALFELLGGWVTTTGEAAAQQLFAEAGHRHAWHAVLWSDRRPTIGLDPGDDSQTVSGTPTDAAGRVTLYQRELMRLRHRSHEIRARTDRVLDPSTARVLDLVDADVAAMHDRTAALV